ncbi:hypothetical protein [Paraglaciecola psychrophila]|nr:hypothetical protein [Paraglaciecola psychrophila]
MLEVISVSGTSTSGFGASSSLPGFGYSAYGGSGGGGTQGSIDDVEKCEIKASGEKGTCNIIAVAVHALSSVGCVALGAAIGGSTAGTMTPLGVYVAASCAGAATIALAVAVADCDKDYENDKAICD